MKTEGIKKYWMALRMKRYPDADEDACDMRVPCEKCGAETDFLEPLCSGCMEAEELRAFPEIINLTGHPIDIVLHDGSRVSIPHAVVVDRDGREFPAPVPRLQEKTEAVDYTVDGVPIVQKTWAHNPERPLPAPRAGTYYVVSAAIANAHPGRSDLLCPETRKTRDGRIYAVALVRAGKNE